MLEGTRRRGAPGVASVLAIALLAGCGGDDDGTGSGGEPLHRVASCPSDGQAPLPDGEGGVTCVPVGASTAPLDGTWPDATGLSEPVVYCMEGASGGDGSMASPVGTIAEALALSPRTVVLSRGSWSLAATATVDTSVTFVGVGPAGDTTIEGPGDGAALLFTGAGTAGELRGLAVGGVAVRDGASLALRDVRVEGGPVGVEVEGGTLDARNVSIVRAERVGLWLHDGSDGVAQSAVIRDGLRYGVVAEASTLTLRDSLVQDNALDGIALLGGRTGETHVLEGVASLRNGVTALRAEGADAIVEASSLMLGATGVPSGTVGGDGLFVGDGASVDLDRAIETDARRGHGSVLVGNARAGVLASGSGTALSVRGALLGSNEGPGAFIQRSAESSVVGYSLVEDNGALGIGVASAGSIVMIPCNLISATRTGTLVTDVGTLELGDGLSMAEGTATATVEGNTLSDNDRFGAVFSSADATLRNNDGSGNRYGLGSYGSDLDLDGSNAIDGAESPPATPPPTARGMVDLTAAAGF